MLSQDVCTFHNHLAVYNDYGGIVFIADEGERIAKALGEKNKAAILMSHGLLTVGSTVDEAAFLFSLLDHSCDIQLRIEAAAANGRRKVVISDEEAAYNFKMASDPVSPNMVKIADCKLIPTVLRRHCTSNGKPSMTLKLSLAVAPSERDLRSKDLTEGSLSSITRINDSAMVILISLWRAILANIGNGQITRSDSIEPILIGIW